MFLQIAIISVLAKPRAGPTKTIIAANIVAVSVDGFRPCPKRTDGRLDGAAIAGKATATARYQSMEKEGARSGRYPVAGGVLTVGTCIFLAGVFLSADAARRQA